MEQELLLGFGALLITGLTQLSKMIDEKLHFKVMPKTLAALLAVIFGIVYALLKQLTGYDLIKEVSVNGLVVWTGAIAAYEVIKTAYKLYEKHKTVQTPPTGV